LGRVVGVGGEGALGVGGREHGGENPVAWVRSLAVCGGLVGGVGGGKGVGVRRTD
jgi:hypothetical protein